MSLFPQHAVLGEAVQGGRGFARVPIAGDVIRPKAIYHNHQNGTHGNRLS